MVLESVLCLELQHEDLKKAGMLQRGVMTPATAMESLFVSRLQNAGIKYEILDA